MHREQDFFGVKQAISQASLTVNYLNHQLLLVVSQRLKTRYYNLFLVTQ